MKVMPEVPTFTKHASGYKQPKDTSTAFKIKKNHQNVIGPVLWCFNSLTWKMWLCSQDWEACARFEGTIDVSIFLNIKKTTRRMGHWLEIQNCHSLNYYFIRWIFHVCSENSTETFAWRQRKFEWQEGIVLVKTNHDSIVNLSSLKRCSEGL